MSNPVQSLLPRLHSTCRGRLVISATVTLVTTIIAGLALGLNHDMPFEHIVQVMKDQPYYFISSGVSLLLLSVIYVGTKAIEKKTTPPFVPPKLPVSPVEAPQITNSTHSSGNPASSQVIPNQVPDPTNTSIKSLSSQAQTPKVSTQPSPSSVPETPSVTTLATSSSSSSSLPTFPVLLHQAHRSALRNIILSSEGAPASTLPGDEDTAFHEIFRLTGGGRICLGNDAVRRALRNHPNEPAILAKTAKEVRSISYLTASTNGITATQDLRYLSREAHEGSSQPNLVISCAGKDSPTLIPSPWGLGVSAIVSPTIRHIQLPMLERTTILYDQYLDSPAFFSALQEIDKAMNNNEFVYVHCMAGQHRSATVVVTYLASRAGVTFEQAWLYVRRFRYIKEYTKTDALTGRALINYPKMCARMGLS